MVTMDNASERYGSRRSYITVGSSRMKCGKIAKIRYGEVELMILKFVKFEGSRRLSELIHSLEKYMGVCLDSERIKTRLGDKVVERWVYNEDTGVLVVEDWVVI